MKKEGNKGMIFFSLLLIIGGLILIYSCYYSYSNKNKAIEGKKEFLEDVWIRGHYGVGDDYTFNIEKDNVEKEYKVVDEYKKLFTELGSYYHDVIVNIYYVENGDYLTVTNYQLYDRKTNEAITGIDTIEDLRTYLGLYNTGMFTEDLELTEIGIITHNYNSDEGKSTCYNNYFTNSNGIMMEICYKVRDGVDTYDESLFEQGATYNVTFEVTKDGSYYSYEIKNIIKK